MATWVKICGVTRAADALAAFECGADAIGINFWPGSKRYCERSRARDLVAALPSASLVYGVFVGATRAEISAIVREVGLTGVQFHGGEAEEEAEGWDLPVIRAVAATSREAVSSALAARATYRVLVDHAAGGGSGLTVDTALLDGLDLSRAVLAGGLTPHNVAASVARLRPFGVDTAGGVETAPGIKDARLIEAFIRNARGA
ncbi:MAG: N-(5'-phosphoribosyl)anthranilate isomerase [Candidatus Binatia bacterium]